MTATIMIASGVHIPRGSFTARAFHVVGDAVQAHRAAFRGMGDRGAYATRCGFGDVRAYAAALATWDAAAARLRRSERAAGLVWYRAKRRQPGRSGKTMAKQSKKYAVTVANADGTERTETFGSGAPVRRPR